MVLGHDLTRISTDTVKGRFKGRAFKKGHVVTPDDIPTLLEMGKEHLYVLTLEDGFVHEDEAARRIARALAGPGLTLSEVCEGRVNLRAVCDGLFKVDPEALRRVNSLPGIAVATLHTNQAVTRGRETAGARIVPLVIEEERVAEVEALCAAASPVADVVAFRPLRAGLVTTGSEVYHNRIKDTFGPVVRGKLASYGSEVMEQFYVSDDPEKIVAAIRRSLELGAELVLCTGGMSVDPDDRTPSAIRAAGGEVVTYGAPTFPGAMFMLAYLGDVPLLGLPGCVMYHAGSVFELTVPRLLAGERLTRDDIVAMGHGGFCAGCPDCRYPVCPFGKGT